LISKWNQKRQKIQRQEITTDGWILEDSELEVEITDYSYNLLAKESYLKSTKGKLGNTVDQVEQDSKESLQLRPNKKGRKRGQSCLSNKDLTNPNEAEKIQQDNLETSRLLQVLKLGDVFNVFMGSAGCRNVRMKVSDDGTELWVSPPEILPSLKESQLVILHLADVMRIVPGPRTQMFKNYDFLNNNPQDCFSLLFPGRITLDIECKSRDNFMNWYQGLQYLVPRNYRHLSRGRLNWTRAIILSLKRARKTSQTVIVVWRHLVLDAKNPEQYINEEMHDKLHVKSGK